MAGLNPAGVRSTSNTSYFRGCLILYRLVILSNAITVWFEAMLDPGRRQPRRMRSYSE